MPHDEITRYTQKQYKHSFFYMETRTYSNKKHTLYSVVYIGKIIPLWCHHTGKIHTFFKKKTRPEL
jgi:hypothetical protein